MAVLRDSLHFVFNYSVDYGKRTFRDGRITLLLASYPFLKRSYYTEIDIHRLEVAPAVIADIMSHRAYCRFRCKLYGFLAAKPPRKTYSRRKAARNAFNISLNARYLSRKIYVISAFYAEVAVKLPRFSMAISYPVPEMQGFDFSVIFVKVSSK